MRQIQSGTTLRRYDITACVFSMLSIIHVASASLTEKSIAVHDFLANVNLTQPKLFYVRNNLDGDIEFRNSENVSLEVGVFADKQDELERVKVEYHLLDNVVDIQVFLIPETTTNWLLVRGVAGASGAVVTIVLVIVMVLCYKRRRNKKLKFVDGDKMELKERGKAVAEKCAKFETVSIEDSGESDKYKDSARPTKTRSKLVEDKLATFERLDKKDHSCHQGDKKDSQEKKRVTGDQKSKDEANSLKQHARANISTNPSATQPSGTSPAQSSKFLSARAAFLILTLVAIALGATQRPRAQIVISVPFTFVKNGSKLFFNEKFHGKLILPEGWEMSEGHFEQFAVSEASAFLPSQDPCTDSCQFACDVNIKSCICRKGYEIKGGNCSDIDECQTNRHNCHVKATCNNTVGGFRCTCNSGFWGDGITCQACTTEPCPENSYQSESCSSTHNRICTACTPKCDRTTYQAFGCGLTFDRKCVDISKPLAKNKADNESDVLEVRRGSRIIVHKPSKDSVLLEDRLVLNSTSATFVFGVNSTNRARLHRNSGFFVEVELVQANFVPKYRDYDATSSNENLKFGLDPSFPDIFGGFCRYPAPNHYSIRHELQRDRQTKVKKATCMEHSRDLCPDHVSPGEAYVYRSLNEACDTAETSVICPKPDQKDCILPEDSSKLFCTNYTNILGDIFGIGEDDFLDSPLQSFPDVQCADAYMACKTCRDNCLQCDESRDQASDSCSCCYKDCLAMCTPFYQRSCIQIPKQCAKGDTSQFSLAMDKPSSLSLQFNCFLEFDSPTSLYSLRYRLQHNSRKFSSEWKSKTLEIRDQVDETRSRIRRGTNRLDSLEVSHNTNLDIPSLLYLRGQRASDREEYKFKISSLDDTSAALQSAVQKDTLLFQTKIPFAINTGTWNNAKNCLKLGDWSQIIRDPFVDLKAANVENLGPQTDGAFLYKLRDSRYPPTMTVKISEEESIFKHVLTNASILNDGTFRSSLSRHNTTWNAKISGFLNSCPGFFSLRVVDEVDQVKVVEQDIVVLCPETAFKVEIVVPRKNLEDKERLFSLFLTDSKQELKLQLALVDREARKTKDPVKNIKDDRPSPWVILMPLFVTTGCVLLASIGLMIYAQVTYKDDDTPDGAPSGWRRVKVKEETIDSKKNKLKASGKAINIKEPKDPNRLKRRHLILVAFFVVGRVIYSLVFTFSMAFAVLTLLHAPNVKIIQGYQGFVQSKIDESNAIALKMDQYREREIKKHLDSTEDVQRACDFFLGLQLEWLKFNMTCLIQENHLKLFHKLSKKITSKVTEKVERLKLKVKRRTNKFAADTKRKVQETKEDVTNYGRRVYKNGWFALPRAAYEIKRALGRKKRAIGSSQNLLESQSLASVKMFSDDSDISSVTVLSRRKRSFTDNKFIGFLDFVGAVDKEKLAETESKIKGKLEYLKNGLADFSDILKTGKTPEHPLSTIIMCPLRFMAKAAKEGTKKGIKKLAEEGEEWAEGKSGCLLGNVSDFFAANGSESDFSYNETDTESFSERVSFEEIEGMGNVENVYQVSRSSLIESARGGSYFNVEEGDVIEEMVDSQKKERLQEEGQLKNVTSVYHAEVFLFTKKAVLGVIVVIDILLLVYRCTKTYKIAFGLIRGFEETVEHNETEFQQGKPNKLHRANRLARRLLDIIAQRFSQFLSFCKTLHKRIMRTNLVPMCMAIVATAALLYLAIVLVFNVLNVTVIEELGGYDMIAYRLDNDFKFTNLAIDDQIDFINNNEIPFYKQTMNDTLADYKAMVNDFNQEQEARMARFNQKMCSLEEDKRRCRPDRPTLLEFEPQSCIFPTLKGNYFQDYDGDEYRQRLKRESKLFVDAIRNIVLETIYFVVGVVLLLIVIAVLSYVVFLFLKSRGMVRVKKVHVYKMLPPEILEQFHLKSLETDEQDDKDKADSLTKPKKQTIPEVLLTESRESLNTLKR